MPTPNRTKLPTGDPRYQWLLTDDGSRTLWNAELDESYHSGCGAVAESLTVYLINSGVLARLQSSAPTSVLEYGFGTATAFLMTAAAAIHHGASLSYRGLELELLPSEIFASLKLSNALPKFNSASLGSIQLPSLLNTAQQLLLDFVHWRSSLPLQPRGGIYVWNATNNVRLELLLGDAVDYAPTDSVLFDAIYFDPFSPASAPQLWAEPVFRTAFRSLRGDGRLTSYCVKGVVRSGLALVGFDVQKVPGPSGGKREVLIAIKRMTDTLS